MLYSYKLNANYMKTIPEPKKIDLTTEQAESLRQRLLVPNLNDKDKEILLGMVSFNFWLQEQLSLAKISIGRLKRLFGFRQRKKKPKNSDNLNNSAQDTLSPTQPTADNAPSANDETTASIKEPSITKSEKKKPIWQAAANHGRYGFDDYSGLETIVIPHQHLHAGDACPGCKADGFSGKVYDYDAMYVIRLVGQPLVTGTRYQLAGFRCRFCGDIYKPEVPKAIKEAPKFAPSAVSNIAIGHYYLGLPTLIA